MKTLIITAAIALLATPALAKEYSIKWMSDPAGSKPYFFSPEKLTIQPGDTVTFVNAQDDMHDVMFVNVPKGVDEMIMSPMKERQGETFSHTFTVPGTYQFHCHPHEALGMKGTIIVGRPSRPGETVAMDHHAMANDANHTPGDGRQESSAQTGQIEATGKVNSLDVSGRTANISHDPIPTLGWPKMRMEFPVETGVNLTDIQAGDKVTFTLKMQGEDNYVVTGISKQ